MSTKPLSQTVTGKAWLENFDRTDRPTARSLLDALVLYNDEEVAHSIRKQLELLSLERSGKRKRVALYAEREIQEKQIFETVDLPLVEGKTRERAVGRKARAPVKPVRGGVRVGSEGPVSNLISQAVDTHKGHFVNTPGPDSIRSKNRPISTIAIVTDFIGSGSRISKMLDKFWSVKTVRSWVSTDLIDFVVIGAIGTLEGIAEVEHHLTKPDVRTQHIAPTMDSEIFERECDDWVQLIDKLNAHTEEDEYAFGYLGSAAMILLNYKIPNNTPSILWKGLGNIRPLFSGSAPEELREFFWATSKSEKVSRTASERGISLDSEGDVEEQIMLLVLQEIRGRFKKGTSRQLSESLALSKPDISTALSDAYGRGLLGNDGRLTDLGYKALDANNISREKEVLVPTNEKSYYPQVLRGPKGSSSTSRSKERP